MNKFSKLTAASAGIALVAGAGLSASAAPTSGPTASVTPQPTHLTPYPTTTVVTSSPSGTSTPAPTVMPTTVTPTPLPTVFPQPTGQIPTGSLAYTFSSDCRSLTVSATGFPAEATELFVDYGPTGNTIVGSNPKMASDKMTAGSGTATVTLKDGEEPRHVTVWVSRYVNGEELVYTMEDFLPRCGIQAIDVYQAAQTRPSIAYSVPSCTMDSRPTVPVTVTVTNNDTTTMSGWLALMDYSLVETYVPANGENAVDIDGIAPGAQGQWVIDLPRGFWGAFTAIHNDERMGSTYRQQALNVEQCTQARTAMVTADTATCEQPSFTILNPKDEYAAAVTYSWTFTDAAGKVQTGTLAELADGASATLALSAPAGVGKLVVTATDGTTTSREASVLSCSVGIKPARTGHQG